MKVAVVIASLIFSSTASAQLLLRPKAQTPAPVPVETVTPAPEPEAPATSSQLAVTPEAPTVSVVMPAPRISDALRQKLAEEQKARVENDPYKSVRCSNGNYTNDPVSANWLIEKVLGISGSFGPRIYHTADGNPSRLHRDGGWFQLANKRGALVFIVPAKEGIGAFLGAKGEVPAAICVRDDNTLSAKVNASEYDMGIFSVDINRVNSRAIQLTGTDGNETLSGTFAIQ